MVRAALLVVATLHSACLRDQLVPCGDELCPAGSTCTPGGCAAPDAVAACDGHVDGDSCTTPTIAMGTCHQGACRPAVCGNGYVDPGEVCDDGNTISGDGCSSDCRSLEMCGNGIVDGVVGEQCDSGLAGLSGDGCTSRCTVEYDAWNQVTPTGPTTRFLHGAVTTATGVLVFGGESTINSVTFDETWEWDGLEWLRRITRHAPPARERFAIAYDTNRHRVVVFGGASVSVATGVQVRLGDTWEYDGIDWTERTPALSPGARAEAAMAYDAATGKIVMFGGRDATGELAETWEWDGTTWTQRTTLPAPSIRAGHTMAYDPVAQKVILFGGATIVNTTINYLNDTWAWNGNAWANVTPGVSPGGRRFHIMTYDPARSSVVMFNGLGASDLWEWNGSAWTSGGGVPIPLDAAGAYDPGTAKVVAGGGFDFNRFPTSTWAGSWTFISPASPGSIRAMSLDPLRGKVVLVDAATTWEWDGVSYRHRAVPGPVVDTAAMAYDETRGRTVLVGSTVNGPVQTWTWDGSTWLHVTPATSPPTRTWFAVAYDRARARVVLHGGGQLNDLWEWDGTTWMKAMPTVSPPIAALPLLAYDAHRDRTVLYNGTADVWEWDGAQWTKTTPATSPPARAWASLVYDPLHEQVTLFGGFGPASRNDTWEWDGTTWTERLAVSTAPRRWQACTAIDPTGGLIVYGGLDDLATNLTDTWRLRTESPETPRETCAIATEDTDGDGLAGCADPDCWMRCKPLCPPGAPCDPTAPRCGDGTCGPVEDYLICPADCPP